MNIIIVVITFVVYIFSSRIFDDIWKKERKIIVNKEYDLFIIFISSVLCISLNLLINTSLPLIGDWFVGENNNIDSNLLFNSIFAVISIVLAPLLEEVFFRYYLYNKIKTSTNIVLATTITSIIFGFIHFYGVVALLSCICLGIILQIVYNKTGNLMNVIIIHLICNLIISFINVIGITFNTITLSIVITLFVSSFLIFLNKIKRKTQTFK